jgi:hypothetical protein
MSNKRSKRKRTQKFFCSYCEQQLWRLGSPKHHLFYKEVPDIKRNLNISHKSAVFLATKGAYTDRSSWIEEFFCREHGKLWMLVRRKPDGILDAVPAGADHWKSTTKTIDPDLPNPSVSEFSYRMSRRSGVELVGRVRSI